MDGATRSAALAQYRTCVRVLDYELGVAPLGETTGLYQAIRENRAPAAPSRLHRRPPHRRADRAQPWWDAAAI